MSGGFLFQKGKIQIISVKRLFLSLYKMKVAITILFILSTFFQTCLAGQQSYVTFDNLDHRTQQLCVRAIAQDQHRMMWFGAESGLYSYDGYHLRRHALDVPDSTRATGFMHIGSINSLLTVGDTLLIGCNNGVLTYDINTQQITRHPYGHGERVVQLLKEKNDTWVVTEKSIFVNGKPMPQNLGTITACCTSERGMWIGTLEAVYLYSFSDMKPSIVTRDVKYTTCFLPTDNPDIFWIGTGSKLLLHDFLNKQDLFSLDIPVAKNIAYDKDGNLLLGTDNGLYIVTPDHQVRIVRHDARMGNSLAGDAVWSTFFDAEGNCWIGSNCGISLHAHNGRITTYALPEVTGEGTGNQIFCLCIDSKGRTWMGGSNGLLCIEDFGTNNQHCRWYRMDNQEYPLSHNRIRDIKEDRRHRLWVGGDGGLMLLNETTLQFEQYYIANDARNWVYNIDENSEGELLITTFYATYFGNPDQPQHLFKSKQRLHRHKVDVKNSFQKVEKYGDPDLYYSIFEDSIHNRILLGGIDCFAVIDLRQTPVEPHVSITDILVNDSRYVQRSQIQGKHLDFDPKDAVLTFMFSDFDYSHQLSQSYYFKTSRDGNWIRVQSSDNMFVIPNLSPGEYELYIRHSSEPESDDAATPLLTFSVLSPWYASRTAIVIYIALAMLLSYAIGKIINIRKRLKRVSNWHTELLKTSKEKETELQNTNEYLEAQLRIHMQNAKNNDESLSPDERFLKSITQIIEDNMSDSNLNIQQLCDLSGLNKNDLYRKVKMATGMSTVAYIRDLRLKKAASLLQSDHHSVSEVMYMVGFSCASYFTRAFNESYGVTPSEYKNRHSGKHNSPDDGTPS